MATIRLRIHIIDVGQGDCSIIEFLDTDTGDGNGVLIDGGNFGLGERILRYLISYPQLVIRACIVTHNDDDHYGGIQDLLVLDNLRVHLTVVASELYQALMPGGTSVHLSRFPAIIDGIIRPLFNWSEVDAGELARKLETAMSQAIGIQDVKRVIDCIAVSMWDCIIEAKYEYEIPIWCGDLRQAEFYLNTFQMNEKFRSIVLGNLHQLSSLFAKSPSQITRTIPAFSIGDQMFAHMFPDVIKGAFNSQQMDITFVAVCGAAGAAGGGVEGDTPTNCSSIAVIVNFFGAFYYSGGDLPKMGEELIVTAVKQGRFPLLPPDLRMAAIKCGHHGSATATSEHMLNEWKPVVAAISAGDQLTPGDANFGHPPITTLLRLRDFGVRRVYMTAWEQADGYEEDPTFVVAGSTEWVEEIVEKEEVCYVETESDIEEVIQIVQSTKRAVNEEAVRYFGDILLQIETNPAGGPFPPDRIEIEHYGFDVTSVEAGGIMQTQYSDVYLHQDKFPLN